MTEQEAWNEIQKKWNEIKELFNGMPETKKKKRLQTILEGKDTPELKLIDRVTKSDSTNFIIKYGGEPHYSKGRHGADALRDFIRWVGVEEVYKLKIHANRNQKLITDISNYQGNYSPKDVIGKYVIFTKSENKEKMIQIAEIIKGTDGLEATIEEDNS